MLGHELRNPLAPILTALQLMDMREPGRSTRERAILDRQVKHLVRLVDDLLDVSRIANGKIDLAKAPVDLEDAVAKALELAAPLIEERRHQVDVQIAPELRVMGDSVRLVQAFTNLLSNAAKYSDPGGRIEISGRRDAGEVVLTVRDNGMGIPPDLLPRVFELFVQGKQAIDRAKGGLGLGLAIVRTVVELHGGRVSAHSAGPERGTEFRVVLPALDGAAAGTPPSSQSEGSAPRPAREAKAKVLIVDDNQDALELMRDALEVAGYEVQTAAEPAAALVRAAEMKPDVALVDIGLPVMDGYQLAGRLRELPGLERIKLVAVTGYGQAADKARASAAGFDEHLVKPVSLDVLDAALERLGFRAR
jgi:CheY-like chemotaxis protein